MRLASLLLLALAMLVVPMSAWAGTKYKANLVPVTVLDPNNLDPNNPGTLENKSKIQASDKGVFQTKLKGVVDGAGTLVKTDGSFLGLQAQGILFTLLGSLTGDEYVTVVSGTFPGQGNVAFEFNLVAELKKGGGKAKIDASGLFSLIPGATLRSVAITAVEVHGPLGAANVAACTSNLELGAFFLPGAIPNPCVGGDWIGAAGFQVE